MASAAFRIEMARQNDSQPKIKVEFVSPSNVTTDITSYYLSGANFSFKKERAPDEIQAGNFDVVLSNHDNYFSEFVATSLVYGMNYIAAKIKISLGFVLPDGTEEYESQAVGLIDQLLVSPNESTVTFRCRDRIQIILDSVLRSPPEAERVVANSANAGNGSVSRIETKPFANIAQSWTLTCTTAGGDGTALFSVVGSVSGSVGPATSGTNFSSNSGGIKFTVNAGSSEWGAGDSFTFTTKKAPEWTGENAVKIIWSILTGYNFDSDTQEAWWDSVLNLDHTKSDSNVDLDYDTFVDAISAVDVVLGDIKGFIPYNSAPREVLESLILLFQGSLYTGGDGRIEVQAFAPPFGGITISTEFSDDGQIHFDGFGYVRTKDEIINSITISFRPFDDWEFSDGTAEYSTATFEDSASIAIYKRLPLSFSSPWFQPNGVQAESVAQRLMLRYASPPITYEFTTGLDGVLTEIGDLIKITDAKYNVSEQVVEVVEVNKRFDSSPKTITIRAREEEEITTTLWAFLGSSSNEGDGLSPQALNWDSATVSDKYFAYLSQTGGGGPDYRMF